MVKPSECYKHPSLETNSRNYITMRLRSCLVHEIGEFTHHSKSDELYTRKLFSCISPLCSNRLQHLVNRPMACVKQNFKIQVEKERQKHIEL